MRYSIIITYPIVVFTFLMISFSMCTGESTTRDVITPTSCYTVTFESNGGDSAVVQQKICDGKLAIEPVPAPTKGKEYFAGWFTDEGLTTAFDFSKPVLSDIKLYAKWKATITVRFDTNMGDSLAPMEVSYNTILGSVVPKREYFDFVEWQKDGKTFNTAITPITEQPITLTAIWKDIDDAYTPMKIDRTTIIDRCLPFVYIVPKGRKPLPGYRGRLDTLIKGMQKFYQQEMINNLGKNYTFGVEIGNKSKMVRIITIYGDQPMEYYTGANRGAINNMVAKYLVDNKYAPKALSGKQSEIIFIPVYPDAVGIKYDYTGGYPNAMVTDDPRKLNSSNIDYSPKYGWNGGLMHETGHAFFISHSAFSYDEEIRLKTSYDLMGSGNHKVRDEPEKVHLALGAARILERSVLFNDNIIPNNADYDDNAFIPLSIQTLKVKGEADGIRFSLKINPTKKKIRYINVIQHAHSEPPPNDEEQQIIEHFGYRRNMFSYEFPDNNVDMVDAFIPYNKLYYTLDDLYNTKKRMDFYLDIVYENHWVDINTYNPALLSYYFVKDPVTQKIYANVNFDSSYQLYTDRINWKIINPSSEQAPSTSSTTTYYASNMIDGNFTTAWGATDNVQRTQALHNFTLDMGNARDLSGLSLILYEKIGWGRVKTFTVQYSNDNLNWTSIGDVYTISLNYPNEYQYAVFPNKVNARYFRITITDVFHSSSNNTYAKAAYVAELIPFLRPSVP